MVAAAEGADSGVEHELILGRYRPLDDLGEGGHGTVVLAYDTRMQRRVAIKRIPLSRAGIRRLDRTTGLAEARTSALLNHPNIVTVHEWDTDADEAFLIMEHVDGAPLLDILDEYAPLDLDTAAAVLTPVAQALSFAHDNGVLHLDLKPENVLVTHNGLVKVADFGVASLTNAAGQAISAGGTLGYMPPEQLLGEMVDAASDQWAFAALAFEVLTGAVPFAARTVDEALHKADDLDPPFATDFVRSLPPALDEVLADALSPVPTERFASVEEFAAELLPLLGDQESGRDELASMATELAAEEEPARDSLGRVGLWDRLVPARGVLLRLAAAIACAWLAWAGLSTWTRGIGLAAAAAGTALVALAGAAAPPLGLALGLLLAATASHATVQVAVALLLSAAWWTLLARRSAWAGIAPIYAPAAAVAGVGPALPMLAGFFLPKVWEAAAAGAMSGVLAIWAGLWPGTSFTGDFTMLELGPFAPLPHLAARTPGWWLAALATVAGWALAAALMSLACRRATRPAALGGAVVASVAILAAAGPWVTGTQRLVPEVAVGVGLSLILMCVVIALGPPVTAEPDDDASEQGGT